MKVMFSADWHIKLNTKSIPNEWAINRYNILFEQLHALEAEVDLHIIGGDVFDKLPNMQELELFFKYISGCTVDTEIIPGNHEALKKNTTFLSHLKDVAKNINKRVRIVDDFYSLENIDFIPYNKLKEYDPQHIDFHGNILVTHVRGEIPPHVKPEVDLDIFNRWDVVLAGDLHSYANSQRNILYPGSPVTTSFHRNRVDTGVIIIDTETLTHTWHKLEVPQLIRKTITNEKDMVATDYDHTIYELEGDITELGGIKDSALLDKKIVKKDLDTALILEPTMTIEDEIVEYLKYIVQVPDDIVEQAIGVYHDNIKGQK
jgi:DNA repair exonuclease SbcCD nuclease subunit